MKQTRITRTSRAARRPAPESTPLPVSPASSTTAAGALIGRIDRLLSQR